MPPIEPSANRLLGSEEHLSQVSGLATAYSARIVALHETFSARLKEHHGAIRRADSGRRKRIGEMKAWCDALMKGLDWTRAGRKAEAEYRQWKADQPALPNLDALEALKSAEPPLRRIGSEFDKRIAVTQKPGMTPSERVAAFRLCFRQFQDFLVEQSGAVDDVQVIIERAEAPIAVLDGEIARLRAWGEAMGKGLSLSRRFRRAKRHLRGCAAKPDFAETAARARRQFRSLFRELHEELSRLFWALDGVDPSQNPDGDGNPLVSIVVPVTNEPCMLRCLQSVFSAGDRASFEVLLVDGASGAGDYGDLDQQLPVRLVRNESNGGLVRACNRGAAAARGEYLVFLNNNAWVHPGWLDALAETFRAHPDAGMAGSKLLSADGKLQEAGGIVWNDGSTTPYGRGCDPQRLPFNYFRETDYCSGACLMLPRSVFERLGGFDLHFAPALYEDVDLAFRVRQQTLKVYYQPGSVVTQYPDGRDGTDETKRSQEHQIKFRERWSALLEAEHFPPGANLVPARDRSRSRRMMVAIDHRVPTPDQDAGSRSLVDYLRLFMRRGYHIKFIPGDFRATEPYTRQLQAMGIEVLCDPEFKTNWAAWLEENAEWIDYVFTARTVTTYRFLDSLVRLPKAKLVLLGVDLASLRHRRHYELTGEEAAREWELQEEEMEHKVWAACDVILYPSAVETEHVKSIMPSADARTYPLYILKPQPVEFPPDAPCRRDLIFVGGFLHAPNVDGIVWFVENCWPTIAREAPEATLQIVGSHAPEAVTRLAGERIVVAGWVDDAELARRYQSVRVAVVPLRFGAGIKGKVLEAVTKHLPAVITPIAAEGLPEIGSVFPVAADAASFTSAVLDLYHSPERRMEIAARCDGFIEKHFGEEHALKVLDLPDPSPTVQPGGQRK